MRQERFVLLNQKIKYHHKKYLCEEHFKVFGRTVLITMKLLAVID